MSTLVTQPAAIARRVASPARAGLGRAWRRNGAGYLFLLPWLDRSPVKSIRYRGAYYKTALALFVVAFLVLGYLGIEPTTVWGQFSVSEGSMMDRVLDTKDRATWVARLCTILYFAFFILMPWWSAMGQTKAVPERVPSHD